MATHDDNPKWHWRQFEFALPDNQTRMFSTLGSAYNFINRSQVIEAFNQVKNKRGFTEEDVILTNVIELGYMTEEEFDS